MKNKICYIIPSQEIGGTEKMLIMLADNIRKYGFQVVVITMQKEGTFHKFLALHNIKYYALDLKKNPFAGILKAVYIFMKEKPCIVHSFLFAGNMFAKFMKIFFRIPLICSQRSTDNWKKTIHWKLEKITDFLCSMIISNSNAGKKILIEKTGIKPDKIVVIPNGIDIKKIAESVFDKKNNTGEILVGSIGSLRKAKGFDILVEAASIVSRKRRDIKFMILGKGPLESYIRQQITRLGLNETVVLCGFIENVYNYMVSFDMVVIPSRWEGFPVVALEAMACGKPVIATTTGDLPEIVEHGITGLLVEPENPKEMADAILKVASNEKMREEMGKNAMIRVENFSLENMVREYRKTYEVFIRK